MLSWDLLYSISLGRHALAKAFAATVPKSLPQYQEFDLMPHYKFSLLLSQVSIVA